jgi:hypothetical protein
MVAAVGLATLSTSAVPVAAQGAVAGDGDAPHAGLVVAFGDGRVAERCIALPADEVTGLELLEASGLELRLERSAMGAMVCAIDTVGCLDDTDCWCECGSAEVCRYWAYAKIEDGEWKYSDVGASDRVVEAGEVDGWAWGSGSAEAGSEPPVRTFEEICGAGGEDEEGNEGGSRDASGAGAEEESGSRAVGYAALAVAIAAVAGVYAWARRR